MSITITGSVTFIKSFMVDSTVYNQKRCHVLQWRYSFIVHSQELAPANHGDGHGLQLSCGSRLDLAQAPQATKARKAVFGAAIED
jgi:hypothetical protein